MSCGYIAPASCHYICVLSLMLLYMCLAVHALIPLYIAGAHLASGRALCANSKSHYYIRVCMLVHYSTYYYVSAY